MQEQTTTIDHQDDQRQCCDANEEGPADGESVQLFFNESGYQPSRRHTKPHSQEQHSQHRPHSRARCTGKDENKKNGDGNA